MKKSFVIFGVLIFQAFLIHSRDSITVYMFLLDECRICQEISPEMNAIYEEYGDAFGFVGLFPNFSSKKKGIDAFKEKYNIKFKTKTDYFKTQATKLDATILPEVIVYNETTKEIIYRGAINDLFYSPGKRRQHITNHYLRDALDATLKNQIPAIRETKPVGCFINFNDALN
ncbi:MAG: hypothetical protein WAT22_02420 [Saprospiraceae bacterium]|nr:hypothetical protein [Saprospiraceae bacterium]MBP6447283.1 hypothetical protein [Saprospiraceae bacterium]